MTLDLATILAQINPGDAMDRLGNGNVQMVLAVYCVAVTAGLIWTVRRLLSEMAARVADAQAVTTTTTANAREQAQTQLETNRVMDGLRSDLVAMRRELEALQRLKGG